MVMEDIAYRFYTLSLIKSFLAEKGYSKNTLDHLKLGIEMSNQQLVFRKHLMFTQDFFMNLDIFEIEEDHEKITIKNRFFNVQNELCATVIINA